MFVLLRYLMKKWSFSHCRGGRFDRKILLLRLLSRKPHPEGSTRRERRGCRWGGIRLTPTPRSSRAVGGTEIDNATNKTNHARKRKR